MCFFFPIFKIVFITEAEKSAEGPDSELVSFTL